jgi:hypothetical protein
LRVVEEGKTYSLHDSNAENQVQIAAFQSIFISIPFSPLLSISLSENHETSELIDGVGATLFNDHDCDVSLYALSLQNTVIVFDHSVNTQFESDSDI